MIRFYKELPKAVGISLIIFLALLFIQYLIDGKIEANGIPLQLFTIMLYGISLFFANGFVFGVFDKIYSENRFTPQRLIFGGIASLMVTVLVIFLLRIVEDVLIEGETINQFLKEEKAANYIVSVVITIIVTLGLYAFHFYKAFQEHKLKEQKIIAGTASAKFESLKNQIDPHFLFNSLNVLSSLIEENPEMAQKFTTSLSKVYRYVLEQKDKELVSVEEEINFAKTYMNLLKMRFENSITFELPSIDQVNLLTVNEDENKVVPLSLQLLLENCIKHNVVSEQKPLHIKIYINNNQLIVENNFQKKETLSERKGVGIANIVNRYAILTKRNVMIEENEKHFKVFLPILTKQIAKMETFEIYSEKSAYDRAKNKVKKIKEFYISLLSYCITIPVLIIINLNTSDLHWFWFPLFGWGLGLLFHGFEALGHKTTWEERKIQEFLSKKNNTKTWN